MVLETNTFTNLDTLIDSYRLECKIQSKSPKTTKIYMTALTILHKFLQQYGLPTDVTKTYSHIFGLPCLLSPQHIPNNIRINYEFAPVRTICVGTRFHTDDYITIALRIAQMVDTLYKTDIKVEIR